MNLHWIDWTIVACLLLAVNFCAYLGRRSIKGVADYLVAGRNVGRYLGLGSDSMQAWGAMTILAFWQMNYQSGFAGQWWYLLFPIAGILITLTGWGIYRLRETRAMTLGQLVEMRHGRKTRIFFGMLVYSAGILNFGIAPVLGANFFIYYCGFPTEIALAGLVIPTVLPIMLLLVTTALVICFFGGQVTLVVTDFLQSVFVNLILIGIMFVLYRMFTWEQFIEAFAAAPNGDALLNPFCANESSEFNRWFFFTIVFYWMFYGVLSWAPDSQMISSTRDAHEARMMRSMVHVRSLMMMGLGLFILPLAVYVLMHHPDFASQAAEVNAALSGIDNEQVHSQMITPAALVHILPVGFMGAFAGVVLSFIITSYDTYLLAWGGILIQDVIIPIKGKPLAPKQHILWIRFSALFVAAFIVIFSLLFRQVDNIWMWMSISASLYTSSAGAVLLGALYWRRGTTAAAWVTMIVGAVLSICGFIYRSINPDFLDGQTIAFWIAILCIFLYVIVSYLSKDPKFPLDEMLNRRPPEPLPSTADACRRRWWQFGTEVHWGDRVLIATIYTTVALFLVVYTGVWVYHLGHDVPTPSWAAFWHIYLYVMFAVGTTFLTWITIGGIRDLYRLFRALKTVDRDIRDDGSVEEHHASGAKRD